MGKKTCSVKITYTYVRTDVRPPLHESRQEVRISSTREVLAVNRMATQTFREKKRQQIGVIFFFFFGLNPNVYTELGNRRKR